MKTYVEEVGQVGHWTAGQFVGTWMGALLAVLVAMLILAWIFLPFMLYSMKRSLEELVALQKAQLKQAVGAPRVPPRMETQRRAEPRIGEF